VRPFVKRFALCYRTVGCAVCMSVLSVRLVYCGRTVGWIRMPLGAEIGLGPGHIVLDGNPAPLPQEGAQLPIFGPCLLWPNGWMDQDATWYGCRPRPRPHCVRWGTQIPLKGAKLPNFQPMSIVSKRSPMSLNWYASTQANCMLDGDPGPPRGAVPILAHVYCG